MRSYSQNGEDRIVWDYFERRGCKGQRSMLEIGAYHPTELSNSRLFIEAGWLVDLVEPGPQQFVRFMDEYKDNAKVVLWNAAVAESERFCEAPRPCRMHWNPYWASTICDSPLYLSKDHPFPCHYWTAALPIDSILDGRVFNFISIDAEGSDLGIARDLAAYCMRRPIARPYALCVEWGQRDRDAWMQVMRQLGLSLELAVNGENLVFAEAY